jgi:hypothetical protein
MKISKKIKKVKHVVTRLKGHATLWWDELHVDRVAKENKELKAGKILSPR